MVMANNNGKDENEHQWQTQNYKVQQAHSTAYHILSSLQLCVCCKSLPLKVSRFNLVRQL